MQAPWSWSRAGRSAASDFLRSCLIAGTDRAAESAGPFTRMLIPLWEESVRAFVELKNTWNPRTMNFKSVAILAASICLVPSALALTDPNLGELSTNDPGAAMNALASGFNYTFSPDAGHGAGGWSAGRPDGHAPIGVMGDHVHKKGEWMVSFRAMRMHMDGMRSGTRRISPNEVFNTQAPGALPGQNFRVTPLEMDTDMYMFGVMHAVTDEWTLMAMVPYLDRSMDHLTAPMLGSQNFTTEAQGLGDIRVSGLRNLHDSDGHRVHLNLGVSVPTGSITERDDAMIQPFIPSVADGGERSAVWIGGEPTHLIIDALKRLRLLSKNRIRKVDDVANGHGSEIGILHRPVKQHVRVLVCRARESG